MSALSDLTAKVKQYRLYVIGVLTAAAAYIAYALDLLGGSTPTP